MPERQFICLKFKDVLNHPGLVETVREYEECSREGQITGLYGKLPPEKILEWYCKSEEIQGLLSYFAFCDGEIVGFFSLRITKPNHQLVTEVYVDNIFVRKAYRNSYFGTKMLHLAHKTAKDLNAMGVYASARPNTKLNDYFAKSGRFILTDLCYFAPNPDFNLEAAC